MITSDHNGEVKWEEKKMNTKIKRKKMNKERRRTMKDHKVIAKGLFIAAVLFLTCAAIPSNSGAQPVPGGTLDPLTIPKYVTPLVIPPVMNNNGTANNYYIAVRQFQQQILPGGIWDTLGGTAYGLPATKVWSYGPAADPTPAIAPDALSQFNYPAYTIETVPTAPFGSGSPVNVRWTNELVADPDNCFDPDGTRKVAPPAGACNFIPHFLPVDQTLHWANPPARDCRMGDPNRTDCATDNPNLYTGPVPIVTHVHGSHVDPESDGYPEAWWLPNADGIPAGYAMHGGLFADAPGTNMGNVGYADYSYRNDQAAATLWYHDHSLGMTRSNVYAGPAGFWLVRGGTYDGGTVGAMGPPAVLPGPAPVAGQAVLDLNNPVNPIRQSIREIPIVIQDRSFNADGSLFYPDNRAFFEGLNVKGTVGTVNEQFPGAGELRIPFVPGSDIAPIWNPEAFFNVMVVNGVSWPTLEVAPALYRFRLLDGCNSRFLNLALKKGGMGAKDVPFYQIGAEQGFLRQVVRIETGSATPLPGNGFDVCPGNAGTKGMAKNCVPPIATDPQQALLMGPAERADVLVDFRGLVDGDIVRMINTAPDAPFGGFPVVPADPATTGQVMQFVVNSALLQPNDALTTPPTNLALNFEPALGATNKTRQVSLNEGESEELCVVVDLAGNVVPAVNSLDDPVLPTSLEPGTGVPCYDTTDMAVIGVPFAPKEALLGTVDCVDAMGVFLHQSTPDTPCVTAAGEVPVGNPLKWTAIGEGDQRWFNVNVSPEPVSVWVTENPDLGAIEEWEIYNFTADAHPIHQHLVRFEIVSRQPLPGGVAVSSVLQPWESGFKDMVIAYPGEITTIKSHFDIEGLYVWHCHIVEHEDNEMMRPYFVGAGEPAP